MGFNCSTLSDEQRSIILCAMERAVLDWGWATADDGGDEVRAARIVEAKDAVEAGHYESEDEIVASYVGAWFDDLGLR